MGEAEPSGVVCLICGMEEPPFWWLSDEINPNIKCTPDKNPRAFYPNLACALDGWGQLEGCTGDTDTRE